MLDFAGKVQVHRKSTHGSVCRIVVQLPQVDLNYWILF